jgi:1-phosphofructokinase
VIVTVTANPSLDLTYLMDAASGLSDLTLEVHRAASVSIEASGKGVNVSRALTLAGRPSPAVLLSGGAIGRQLTSLLAAEQIPHRAVWQAGATRVNTTVLSPDGRTLKLNAPGAAVSPDEYDNLVMAVDHELVTLSSESGQSNGPNGEPIGPSGSLTAAESTANWLLICGSLPPGADPQSLIGQLVNRAHGHGWRVAVDSSGAGLTAGFEAGADLLAPNAAELSAVLDPDLNRDLNSNLNPDGDLFRAATEQARRRGCELLVSLGADGALWTDGRRTLHVRGPAVVPVNSAGAGDALLAGWFFAAPADPARRLATAVAWGTAACLAPTTVATGPPPPSNNSVLVSDLLEAP